MLYATGEGAVPDAKEQPNRAKAYLQAKSYAKMEAIASLVQEVRGTMISYCSNGRDYVADTRIKEEIKGVLDCVHVISAKKRPEGKDTIVEVTVRAPKPALPKAPPAPRGPSRPQGSGRPIVAQGLSSRPPRMAAYTSVVIDATGLKVLRSMSPKILRPDGSEVWGTLKVDPDILSDYGIAAYVAQPRGGLREPPLRRAPAGHAGPSPAAHPSRSPTWSYSDAERTSDRGRPPGRIPRRPARDHSRGPPRK